MHEIRIAQRYVLQEELGVGSMGRVFKGLDILNDKPVAVKQLKAERLSPDMIERFNREGQALRDLNHPNIVTMVDVVEEGTNHYLIMEYVPGGDLSSLLAGAPDGLSTEHALTIALDLADALTRAHRLDIIHRDLKPANILIADDGTPRLTDFGLAHIGGLESLTGSGDVIGTLFYLSPEACLGAAIDHRADIWAFGAILYEMLTGHRLFDGTSAAEVLNGILHKPLATMPEHLPDSLLDLLFRMLDRNPELRLPTIRLAGAELEAISRGIDLFPDRSLSAVFRSTSDTNPRLGLPSPTTPFIGRQRALDELAALVDSGDCRLLTVVGPGGIGKTRLAQEFGARGLSQFRDGVAFVPLAPLQNTTHIVYSVADVLGVQFKGRENPQQQLLKFLHDKHFLLIMDNFEHLLEGASLLLEMLDTALRLTILVTSRARLNLRSETIYEVKGLDLPEAQDQSDFEEVEAVNIFITYARRAQRDFELPKEERAALLRLCHLTEGMPLALELAAGWTRALTPSEIVDEMERDLGLLAADSLDLPERQRSMQAAFHHSWKFLSNIQQDTLMKLAVFRGGFTRNAAAAIADANVRTLMALVDQSMIRRDPYTGRYGIHELIRQFAEAKLAERGTHDNTCQRHAAYLLSLAEKAGQLLDDAQSDVSLYGTQIGPEIDNCRAALQWSLDTEKTELALRLANTIVWSLVGGRAEGEHWLFTALEADGECSPPEVLAEAYTKLSWLAVMGRGLHLDRVQAIESAKRALALYRELGDRASVARAMTLISNMYWGYDWESSRHFLKEALELWEELGVEDTETLELMGSTEAVMGHYSEARSTFERCLVLAQKRGDPERIAWFKVCLGQVDIRTGNLDRAKQLIFEARDYYEPVYNAAGMSQVAVGLGRISLENGDLSKARKQLEQSIRYIRQCNWLFILVYPLLSMACLLTMEDQHERAAVLVGAIDQITDHYDEPVHPAEHPTFDHLVSALQMKLGIHAFDTARRQGFAMTLDEIMDYALMAI